MALAERGSPEKPPKPPRTEPYAVVGPYCQIRFVSVAPCGSTRPWSVAPLLVMWVAAPVTTVGGWAASTTAPPPRSASTTEINAVRRIHRVCGARFQTAMEGLDVVDPVDAQQRP